MKSTGLHIAILFLLSSLTVGCAHTWSPGQAPPIPIESVGQRSPNLSVDLINNQPINTPQLFGFFYGDTHYANYNEWTEFFVKYWGDELKKRGVLVGSQSPNKIAVKLDNFMYMQKPFVARINMKIHLSNYDNTWVKDFEETDTSGWSIGRAFGSLIYHSVEKLLKDPDVMGRMKSWPP